MDTDIRIISFCMMDFLCHQETKAYHFKGQFQVLESLKPSNKLVSLMLKNGNTFWCDVIHKKMENIMIAFDEFNCDIDDILSGYHEIKYHMIFDIKMGKYFKSKAQMVTGDM